jgi:hypothetical protein
VHSSTSSSEAAAPGRWGRGLALGVALYLLAIGTLEVAGRRAGYVPIAASDNDRALWAAQRERVDRGGPNTLALVGNSRMLRAFSSDAFRRELPDGDWIQLALPGTEPGAVLRDLLLDRQLRGILVCGIWEGDRFWDVAPQAPYVTYFHERWGWNERWNARLRFFVNEHLVSMLTQMNPLWRLFFALQDGPALGPQYRRFTRDRMNLIDFELPAWSAVTAKRQQEGIWWLRNSARPQGLEERARAWVEHALTLEPLIRDFQARGGRMVYLRLPSSNPADADGRLRQTLREAYWSGFAARTAATTIYFLDVPDLRDVATPDAAHIDGRDAPRLTRAVVEELRRRGVLAAGP